VDMPGRQGHVIVHFEQPVSANGQRLCCNCKARITAHEPQGASTITASVLLLFCSCKCDPLSCAVHVLAIGRALVAASSRGLGCL
jgi:hypothetical protein